MRIAIIIYSLLVSFLMSIPSWAMQEDSDINPKEHNPVKSPIVQPKKLHHPILDSQTLDMGEKIKSTNNGCIPRFLLYLDNILSCWNTVSCKRKKTLVLGQNNFQEHKTSIFLLPRTVMYYITEFLGSIDILRLANTCKKFRETYNDVYWISYFSKLPQVYSSLIWNTTLSPFLDRKKFFSHLWYCEGNINLAAKLNHPEALMLRQYGTYGAYIGKDQYLCPSGVIKHISGKIDNEKTNKLRESEHKKAKVDVEKNERRRKIEERTMKIDVLYKRNWKNY